MDQKLANWLLSLDSDLMLLYSLGLFMSAVVFLYQCKSDIKQQVRIGSPLTSLKRFFVLAIPFLLVPTLLLICAWVSMFVDKFLWGFTSTDYGREIWFTGLMLYDVLVAYVIIMAHSWLSVSLTTFGELIYKAWLVKAMLHVITYSQLSLFDEISTLSAVYKLSIPTINIAIGVLVVVQSLLIKRENIIYGKTV